MTLPQDPAPDAPQARRFVRAVLARRTHEFFETMTAHTAQGWPDVPEDEFLSALADALQGWLAGRPDGVALAFAFAQGAHARAASAHPPGPMPSNGPRPGRFQESRKTTHVRASLRKEFQAFLSALGRGQPGGFRACEADDILAAVEEATWRYGEARGRGPAHLATLALDLEDQAPG